MGKWRWGRGKISKSNSNANGQLSSFFDPYQQLNVAFKKNDGKTGRKMERKGSIPPEIYNNKKIQKIKFYSQNVKIQTKSKERTNGKRQHKMNEHRYFFCFCSCLSIGRLFRIDGIAKTKSHNYAEHLHNANRSN